MTQPLRILRYLAAQPDGCALRRDILAATHIPSASLGALCTQMRYGGLLTKLERTRYQITDLGHARLATSSVDISSTNHEPLLIDALNLFNYECAIETSEGWMVPNFREGISASYKVKPAIAFQVIEKLLKLDYIKRAGGTHHFAITEAGMTAYATPEFTDRIDDSRLPS